MFGIVDMTLESKVKVTHTLNCEVEGINICHNHCLGCVDDNAGFGSQI